MKNTQKAPITVQNVTDGLAKLIKEVRQLQSEIAKLTESFHGFKIKHPIPEPRIPYNKGFDWRTRPSTDEPKSAIRDIIYEYQDGDNLEVPTRTLFAIAKELDGALRDVRAARADINAIASDSDSRADFKAWQEDL